MHAIVTTFAEATNCDKSQLLQDFTAYITRYDDSRATYPTPEVTVGVYGYDLIAYRKFMKEHPMEVEGVLKRSDRCKCKILSGWHRDSGGSRAGGAADRQSCGSTGY